MTKANGCVIYMVGPDERDRFDLEESLALLYLFFNKKYQYDVLIYHENLTDEYIDTKILNSDIYSMPFKFIKVNMSGPSNAPIDVIGSSTGYRSMCRWFSGPFFHDKTLAQYKWCWHFDTDSRLMGLVDYDPFLYMEQNNKIYGYQAIYTEADFACRGFWEATKSFIKECNIKPKLLNKFLKNEEWDLSYYYSDFAIFDLNFFRSKEYMDYFNYLDKLDGFYKHRWGDTLVCSLGIMMLLDESQTHQFKDIKWRHQRFSNFTIHQ